jgi:hypothetical protein
MFNVMRPLTIPSYTCFFQWENHSKSMKLEAQTLAKIRSRINEKVMGCCGTWIDWQYLLDAAALLAKCRYTLQYTYPYAYYMEPSPRKELVRLMRGTELFKNSFKKKSKAKICNRKFATFLTLLRLTARKCTPS